MSSKAIRASRSVEVSGRLLHNQPPAYQLDLLARNVYVEELFRGDWHGGSG